MSPPSEHTSPVRSLLGADSRAKASSVQSLHPSLLSQPQESSLTLLSKTADAASSPGFPDNPPRLSEGSAGVRDIVSLEINFPVDFLISLN